MKRRGIPIELSARQAEILELVQKHEPITGEQIADRLGVSRPTIRSDLSILVMLGFLDAKPKVGYFLGTVATRSDQHIQKLAELKVKQVQGMPVAVRETATVNDAVVTMFLENVGSLIITDEHNGLAGIVSRKDLLKVTLGNAQAASMPISLVMTRHPNIVTVQPDLAILEAAELMIKHQVDSLPVVVPKTESGRERLELVGRISKTTMTRILFEWGMNRL